MRYMHYMCRGLRISCLQHRHCSRLLLLYFRLFGVFIVPRASASSLKYFCSFTLSIFSIWSHNIDSSSSASAWQLLHWLGMLTLNIRHVSHAAVRHSRWLLTVLHGRITQILLTRYTADARAWVAVLLAKVVLGNTPIKVAKAQARSVPWVDREGSQRCCGCGCCCLWSE